MKIPPAAPKTPPTPEEQREDAEDILKAQDANPEPGVKKPFWQYLGPGLITGAADDDPSGIGTYSVAGAQFGYGLLWLIPICVPLMIAVQEMCGRVGRITGVGLAAVIKAHYPRWLLVVVLLGLFGANITNIYADLNIMAASSQMLWHGSFYVWLALWAVLLVVTQILIPYRYYVRVLKWLCLALLAYVVTALLPSVHKNWGQIGFHFFVPQWHNDPQFIITVVGFLGTTISPYLFFWQAGEEVEQEIEEGLEDAPGQRKSPVKGEELRIMRADTIVGMVASQGITFFIVICAAATLNARGITNIDTAQQAAQALRPLGESAYWLFTLGILGAGLLAIPTLAGSVAYAVSETMGWRYGLYRRFARARSFYAVIAVCILLGYLLNFVHALSPVKALLYSAALNGIVAPPLVIVLLFICNDKRIVKDRVNGRASNILGWMTVILMGAAALFLLYAIATGKAA